MLILVMVWVLIQLNAPWYVTVAACLGIPEILLSWLIVLDYLRTYK